MLQIGVIQFVQKRSAEKHSLRVKKINPPWSPGMQEYVESVRSSPINPRNAWKKIVSNLNNTIPHSVRLVDPYIILMK